MGDISADVKSMKYRLKRIDDSRTLRRKFNQAYDFLSPNLTKSGAVYTGLSSTDVERLAPKLGIPVDDLMPPSDPYTISKTGKYWMSFAIKIGNDDIRINTGIPHEEVQYLFLKGHHRVANGNEMATSRHTFVLVDEEFEATQKVKKGRQRVDAYQYYGKMSPIEMRQALRAIGRGDESIGSDNSVQAALMAVIDAQANKFLDLWVNNKEKDQVAWISDAVHYNILRNTDGKYYYGKELLAGSATEMASWRRDAKNKSVAEAIDIELKAKRKLK